MQRRNGLFWGIFLLTLGVLFLARRAGWLDVDWHSLVNLWPLLLILAGVNLILERRGNPAAFVTTVMLAVAVPATLFGFLSHNRNRDEFNMRWHNDDEEDDNGNEADSDDDNGDDDDGNDNDNDNDNEDAYKSERDRRDSESVETHTNTFAETMDAGTNEAVLKLSGGAGRFIIGDPGTELIKADTKQTVGSYSMSVDRDETTHIPTIELKPTEDHQNIDFKDGKFENRVDVHLNAKPVWSMDVALGAGQGDLDLSAYAVKSLKLAAGAADLDLKLGGKSRSVRHKIRCGRGFGYGSRTERSRMPD